VSSQTPETYVEGSKGDINIQGTKHTFSTMITTITAIETTPNTFIPIRLMSTTFDLDNFQPIQEILFLLNIYNFNNTRNTIVRRRKKKRKTWHHEEASQ